VIGSIEQQMHISTVNGGVFFFFTFNSLILKVHGYLMTSAE
jgi:hypothetical protein